MPRNMSFMLTTQQMYERKKTVTRRNGWWFVKPGNVIQAVEKCQGLRKGEKVKKICLIRILKTGPEMLNKMIMDWKYGLQECESEGFPELDPQQFVFMYCKHNNCIPLDNVNRIEFEFL